MEKLNERVNKDYENKMNAVYDIYNEKVFKNTNNDFEKYLFTF